MIPLAFLFLFPIIDGEYLSDFHIGSNDEISWCFEKGAETRC